MCSAVFSMDLFPLKFLLRCKRTCLAVNHCQCALYCLFWAWFSMWCWSFPTSNGRIWLGSPGCRLSSLLFQSNPQHWPRRWKAHAMLMWEFRASCIVVTGPAVAEIPFLFYCNRMCLSLTTTGVDKSVNILIPTCHPNLKTDVGKEVPGRRGEILWKQREYFTLILTLHLIWFPKGCFYIK